MPRRLMPGRWPILSRRPSDERQAFIFQDLEYNPLIEEAMNDAQASNMRGDFDWGLERFVEAACTLARFDHRRILCA